jgi:hypothetical protein
MTRPPASAGAADAAADETLEGSARPLTIEGSAYLVSAWAWAESRLYEVVGGWVPSTTGAAAKIYFDACSQHHSWRARLWDERRPGLPAHLVPSPDSYDRTGSPIEALAALRGDVERLSAYCRVVLPRAVVGYRSWQRRCSTSSDQPAVRALRFALADALADWERGSGLLEVYLGGEGGEQAAVAAAGASREVDQLLARKGLWPARQHDHVLGPAVP